MNEDKPKQQLVEKEELKSKAFKILVVEDEPSITRFIGANLKIISGVKADFSTKAEDAAEILREGKKVNAPLIW